MHSLISALSLFSLVVSLKLPLQNYTLIFKENFSSLDNFEANWDFEIGTGENGWGNAEKQYYRSSKDNIFLEDNQLHIKAIKKAIKDSNYTSARLTTKKTFQFAYGYVKTRIKLPKAKGIWPAFWMLGANMEEVGWPYCGEIDIMETRNDDDIIMSYLHWFSETIKEKGDYGTENTVLNKDEFHTYELLWEQDYIRVFIDEQETFIIDIDKIDTDAFKKKFYFILNVAVGGDFPGDYIDDSKFPLEMIIDYIEVYQKNDSFNYKYSPKIQIMQIAPQYLNFDDYYFNEDIFLKDGTLHIKKNDYLIPPYVVNLTCFKYGELKMRVSLPDIKGVQSKIYLSNREIYYIDENNNIIKDDSKSGEIAVITAQDGTHTIISGTSWNNGDYYKESNEFDITEFNEYTLKWDKNFIVVYGNDIEIYKIDINPLSDFHKYFFLHISIFNKNENNISPEILLKEIKVYQNENDTINGLPKVNGSDNAYINLKLNNWLLIIFIIILILF